MPVGMLAALATAKWEWVGFLAGLYALPHLVRMPHFPITRRMLFFATYRWLGPLGTVRFLDLSSSLKSEPEPEPVPGSCQAVSKPQLLCLHPHGIYCLGVMNVSDHRADVRILSSPYLYNIAPIFRMGLECLYGVKMGSVGRSDLTKLMKSGDSPMMMAPGGFHEATITCPGHERVFLKDRRGFVKYALRFGYDLVPCYTFGETDLMANPQGGWWWRFWLNSWGLPAVLPWGFPLLPYLPRRGIDVVTAVGPPLDLPHILKPTDTDVEKHHARYIEALQKLYDQVAPGTNSRGRRLEIW